MNNINLDINTYNIGELEKLIKLPKNYNNETIYKNKETIENSIQKSNISEAKKTELFIFLDNIKNKLINNLEKVDERNFNLVKQYDGNHFITKNNENTLSTLENNKQINKSIIKRTYTIDSLFRQNYESPDNPSHSYIIQLPETIPKTITMSISCLEIPLTYHNISENYNNNIFTIEILDASNNITDSYNIILSPGLYESRFTTNVTNNETQRIIASNIVTEINDKIQKISNSAISSNLSFVVGSKSGFSGFKFDNSNNYITSSNKLRINFDVNNPNINTTNKTNTSTCYNNEIYQKLGWQLGFRNNNIIIDENSNNSNNILTITSTAICYINYPRYLYIAIDDFQASSRNNFSIAADSIIAPNIIGRINILSLLQEKTAYKQGATAGDYLFTQKNVREYFGPTDINRLRVQLLDEYGRPFSLNNMDWSFIITCECLYN